MPLYNLKTKDLTMSTSVAEKLIEWNAQGHHTGGDVRVLYATLNLRGTGGTGECFRPRTLCYGTSINSAHGMHCTLQVAAGGAISGLGVGVRATFEAAAESRSLTGTLAALQVDSNIGANNTLPGSHAFISAQNVGSVAMTNLFLLPNAANGSVFATHTTDGFSHSIKIVTNNGTPYYIMCTATGTNRG